MIERYDTRDRDRPLKVFVSDSERAFIVESAYTAGMSVSMYLRVTGMHGRPKSALDNKRIIDLIKVAGDLGRMGGLLKLWLSDRADEGASAVEVRQVLHQIEDLLPRLRARMHAAFDQMPT